MQMARKRRRALTRTCADPAWALPTSGVSGSQCFYSCSANLAGGAGNDADQLDMVELTIVRC